METIATAYLLGVNVVSFTMHTEDKVSSKGWLPFLGRIPGANFYSSTAAAVHVE